MPVVAVPYHVLSLSPSAGKGRRAGVDDAFLIADALIP